MNAKHTPGPWKLTADKFAHIVVDTEGNEIHVGTNEADARLIAAAPDLLTVLQDVLNTWDSGSEAFPISDIRAAITKAKGKL